MRHIISSLTMAIMECYHKPNVEEGQTLLTGRDKLEPVDLISKI